MAASSSDPQGRVGFAPPPPGVTPDFDNPQDVKWTLNVAVLIVCNVLVTVCFLLRCYVKLFVTRHILVADYTCLIAWVSIAVYSGTLFTMAHYGLGYHAWEVTVEDYSQVLKWLYASSIVYIPAAYFTKVTLLLLIAHVFAVNERITRGIHLFIWVVLFVYTPVQTIKITICVPIQDYWMPVAAPRCINQRKVFIVDTCIAVLVDFVILLLPIFMTWSLTMSPRKKIKIMLMLGAGGAATAATVFRLVTAIRYVDSPDLTVSFVTIALLACVELTIGLVCACLPSINVLFNRHQSARERARRFNVPRTGRGSTLNEEVSNWWDALMMRTHTVDGTAATALQQHTTPRASAEEARGQPCQSTASDHDVNTTKARSVIETSTTGLRKPDSSLSSQTSRYDGERASCDVEAARM